MTFGFQTARVVQSVGPSGFGILNKMLDSEQTIPGLALLAEYILCAAIWIDDGQKHHNQPVLTGFVIGGYRHSNISSAVKASYPLWMEVRRTSSTHRGLLHRRDGLLIV